MLLESDPIKHFSVRVSSDFSGPDMPQWVWRRVGGAMPTSELEIPAEASNIHITRYGSLITIPGRVVVKYVRQRTCIRDFLIECRYNGSGSNSHPIFNKCGLMQSSRSVR